MRSTWVVAVALSAIAVQSAYAQPDEVMPPNRARPPVPYEEYARPPGQSIFDPDALVAQAVAASPTLEKIARGALSRARRAISIGPTLGLYGASIVSPRDTDAALTFGLGVEVFKVPILPSIENFKALVIERAKAKLVDEVSARFNGHRPDAATIQQLAREVLEEAIEEVLGLENIRPKTMERPRLSIGVEGNRYFDSNVWSTRLRAGIGIWKLTLAGSVSAAFTDPKTSVFAGPEVVAHFLTSRNPRASVLDVFVRADFELRNRGTMNTDTLALGVRYLVDVL